MRAGFKIRIPSNVTALKWLFCAVTAVLVSCVAFAMGLLISGAHTVRQMIITELDGLDGVVSVRGASLMYGAFNASCAFLAASCVLYGAMPAAGSGLPELVTMLNGVEVPQFLTLRTFLMKSIGACASVAASLPLGYQGVLLHIGGMVAGILASWLPHFDLTAGTKRLARADRGLARAVSNASAITVGGRAGSGGDSGGAGGDRPGPAGGPPAADGCEAARRQLNYSMSKVRASSVFAEYLDDDDAAFPTSKWMRKLPRLVEGLARRLPGTGSPRSNPAAPARASACPPTTPASLLDRVHFIASTTFADQVACGAAAGAAAAFRAPIGGMLYLMELSTRWRLELTWRTFFSTSITVLVLKGLSHACKDNSVCKSVQSFLSVSGTTDYTYHFTRPYGQLPVLIVFAAAMGAIGSAFISLNCAIVKLRRRWAHSKALLLLEAVAFTWLYSMLMYTIAATGDCRPCDPSAPNNCNPGLANAFSTMNCHDGQYNPLATLVSSPNGENISSLWTVRFEDFSLHALVLFSVAYFCSAAWTAGLALPSGSFSSTILLGSCFGRIMAHLVQLAGVVPEPDAPLFSLLGAAGLFTGQMRMTVSLCVVLLEMCNTQGTLPFLMVVIIVAKGTADRLGDPLVVRRIKLKGLPFIARMPHLSQRRGRLSAATIVRKADFPLLPPEPSGHLIRQLLNQHPQKPIFVVVRPYAGPGVPAADLSALLSSHAAGRAPSAVLEASLTSAPSWQPGSASPFPDGAATPWESASSAYSGSPQKHVLLGVVARSTLVKLLAHLEVMTAVRNGGGSAGPDRLITMSSGCSGIGPTRDDSIPEELHGDSPSRPLLSKTLSKTHTQSSLAGSRDSLLDAHEDQALLSKQQQNLASALLKNTSPSAANSGKNGAEDTAAASPAARLQQYQRPGASAPEGGRASPFAELASDETPRWPPNQPVQRSEGARLEYQRQSQSMSRDWVQAMHRIPSASRSASRGTTRGASPQAAMLSDEDVMLGSPRSAEAPAGSVGEREETERHVIDMSVPHGDLSPSKSIDFFGGARSAAARSAGSDDAPPAGSGEDHEKRLEAEAIAAVADAVESAAGTSGPRPSPTAVVDGLFGSGGSAGVERAASDATAFLDAKIDLSSAIQVPPIQMDPRVSLEAIFSIMNNMALEIVPIVSTGGVYHGLVTRACMMRFQKKLAK
eukprot:jgi/Ulvmu1/1944/UM012_0105.1